MNDDEGELGLRHGGVDVAQLVVVEGLERVKEMVSAFACHGSTLVVGTTDGSLLSYTVEADLHTKLMVRKALGRGKQRVDKIKVLAALSQLAVLCDGRLDILDLRSLENLSTLALPKSSSSPALGGSSGPPVFYNFCTGLMSSRTGIASSVRHQQQQQQQQSSSDDVRDLRIVGLSRKRLFAYQLPETRTPVKDVALTEQPAAGSPMFMRAGLVYLVYKRAYVRVSLLTDELVPLMSFNGRNASMLPLPGGVLCSTELYSRLIPDLSVADTSSSEGSSTSSTDNTATTTTSIDASAVNFEVVWASPPIGLGYREPYLLGLLPGALAIYNTVSKEHYQSIKLAELASPQLNDEGQRAVLFAAATGFSQLVFHPAEQQVYNLLRQLRIDEALQLFTRLASGDADYKRRLLDVRRDVGFALFACMQFHAAFTHWADSSVNPFDVLECFPDLLSLSTPKYSADAASPAQAASHTRMPRPDVVVVLHKHLPATTSQDSKRRHLEQAQLLLLGFLEHYCLGTSASSSSPSTPSSSSSSSSSSSASASSGSASMSPFDLEKLHLVLLKLYLDMQPEKLLSFIGHERTTLPFDEAQLCLKAKHFYHALGRLCESAHRPRDALDYWRQLGLGQLTDREPRISVSSALNSTVSLLSRVSEQALIWEYSAWVLDVEPTLAINIFTSTLRPRDAALQPDQVLEFLSSRDKSLRLLFLEHLTSAAVQSESRYHTKLAMLYLDAIVPLLSSSSSSSSSSPSLASRSDAATSLDCLREKLLKFLETSASYDCGVVLARIRDLPLYDEQVVLNSKLGQHSIALRIIMEKFRDRARAEAYCEQHSVHDPNIFTELLKLYAHDSADATARVPDAATVRFINHIGHKLAFSDVLQMYPDLPVSKVLPYLKASLQHFHHSRLEDQVEQNLLRANRIALQAKLVDYQRQRAVVTAETKCLKCRREIGDRVFLRYPQGSLVHFKCHAEGPTSR